MRCSERVGLSFCVGRLRPFSKGVLRLEVNIFGVLRPATFWRPRLGPNFYGVLRLTEGFDTSKIVYEVSKILGILETPYGIPRVSRDSQGFWGIPGDSRGFRDFPGIPGDSRGFQGIPGVSKGFQGIPRDSEDSR